MICFLFGHPSLGSPFLFQQNLHAVYGPVCSTGSGILNLVAAVIAGLSPLGGLSKLAPQTLGTIAQSTVDKLFRRGLGFLL